MGLVQVSTLQSGDKDCFALTGYLETRSQKILFATDFTDLFLNDPREFEFVKSVAEALVSLALNSALLRHGNTRNDESSRNLIHPFKHTFLCREDCCAACEKSFILNAVSAGDPAIEIEGRVAIDRNPFAVVLTRQVKVCAV